MLSTSLSKFRKKSKRHLASVSNDGETLILRRRKGKAVVVLALDEFNGLLATEHELSSSINENRSERRKAQREIEKLITPQTSLKRGLIFANESSF